MGWTSNIITRTNLGLILITLGCTPFESRDQDSTISSQGIAEVRVCSESTPVIPVPNTRRLTKQELIFSISDLFGLDPTNLADLIPSDARVEGFDNRESSLVVSRRHVESYSRLSSQVSSQIEMGNLLNEYTECQLQTDLCYLSFINNMALAVFRSPINSHDRELLLDLFKKSTDEQFSFQEGARFVIEAMLQFPAFLYRIEATSPRSKRLATSFELASRLSYLIWNSVPDRELLNHAMSGELQNQQVLEGQIERLLRSSKSRRSLRNYISNWLHFDKLDQVARNPADYPAFGPKTIVDVKTETYLFFEHLIFEQQAGLLDSLNADFTFMNENVAKIYGIELAGEEFRKVDLSTVPERYGLLSQPSVLMTSLDAANDNPSIVLRGLFVNRNILCREVPDPPPDLANDPIQTAPGLSQRVALEQFRQNNRCNSCHSVIDAPGLAFEPFDALGAFRLADNFGNALASRGYMNLKTNTQPFNNWHEFVDRLVKSPGIESCVTRKVLSYSVGKEISSSENCVVNALTARTRAGGVKYTDLLREIALSPTFRYVRRAQEGQQ